MQPIHHVVMTTFKSSKTPGRFQYRSFEGSVHVGPTQPIGDIWIETATIGSELHCQRASGDFVRTQTPAELNVKLADRRVLVRATWNSFNVDGEDLRHRVRTIIQVDPGPLQVEVRSRSGNHGVIGSTQQEHEWIFGFRVIL